MDDSRRYRIFPKKYSFTPYIWLVYMLIPTIYVNEETGFKLVSGYVLLLLFLISYRQLYWVNGKKYDFWIGIQLIIIVIFSLWINPFYVYMGFYPANFIGEYSDKNKFRSALVLLLIIELLPIIYGFLFKGLELENLIFTVPFLLAMFMFPFAIRSIRQKKQLEQQLVEANEQIKLLIKREERIRIARDLHDTLGHTLSLITLKSQLVAKLISRDPDRAVTEAKEIEQTSRAALSQVRELVSDMRTITIEEELTECKYILEAANISLSLQGDGTTHLPSLMQNIISMCIKEAVTNIVKHSYATECTISFTVSSTVITMTVQDDGKGLPEHFQSNTEVQQTSGNGLKGIAERLALIEGSLHLSQSVPVGTTLTITIPLAKRS